jgi:hypothetical protein
MDQAKQRIPLPNEVKREIRNISEKNPKEEN